MATKIIMTGGVRSGTLYKALDPYTDETPGVWASGEKTTQPARLVPSIFAALSARMQAMSDLPFTIYTLKGDRVVDDSDNYKNKIGFLPTPSNMFGLAEGALTLSGQAYWFKGVGTRTGTVKELKYWTPDSVKLDSDKAKAGIIEFKRSGVQNNFPAEQVLYMWGLDPSVELGPPTVYPYASAITAALANGAITQWVADYMSRGAVKAMLLMVEGLPPKDEVERMESWFNRFMVGAKNIGWKVFNSGGVKPTIIGEGIDSLRDLSISADLRYEIHTALGTRHLLEDENYATANARERQFYTMTILPDARLIQSSMNDQMLHAMGYHLEFEPERLEAFQEDESAQADSFLKLFEGFDKVMSTEIAFQLASEKLDYQFSDEQLLLIKKGLAEKSKPAEKTAEVIPPAPIAEVVPPETVKALVELDNWQKKVIAAGKMVTWHAVNLSPAIVKAVKGGASWDEVRAMVKDTKPADSDAVKLLADAINNAVNVPEPRKEEMTQIIIDTQGNVTKAREDGTMAILEAIKAIAQQAAVKETPAPLVIPAPLVTVNIPEQAAPVVNVSAPVTVEAQPAPVNNIYVKPADVTFPPAPTEATITTDKSGKRTLKVTK